MALIHANSPKQLTERQSAPIPKSVPSSSRSAHTGPPILTRLSVTQPDDPAERAADESARYFLHPPKPSKSFRSAPTAPAPSGSLLSTSGGGGQPLDERALRYFEPHLGQSVRGVRIHTDSGAADAAQTLNARAFTHGRDVYFGAGEYQPDTALGRSVLAHELGHVLYNERMPDGGVGRIHRMLQTPPPPTREAVGLPSQHESSQDSKKMPSYLSRQSEEQLRLQEQLAKENPQSPEERAALTSQLERLVRLTAIGMMASHRESIIAARDGFVTEQRRQQVAEHPEGRGEDPAFSELRRVSHAIMRLNEAMEVLEDSRHHLKLAHSNTLGRRGDVGDTLEAIVQHGSAFVSADARAGLSASYSITRSRGTASDYWMFAWGATNYLLRLREVQILGIKQSLSFIHRSHPVFAYLDAASVSSGEIFSDQELFKASEESYQKLVTAVDRAIGQIATGDIHPFDLPLAVQMTRTWLNGPTKQALDEAIRDREVLDFWKGIGLSLLETLVVFIPVVGPVIAAGLAVSQLGVAVEDMLDRAAQAEAATDPHTGPLGAISTSTIEWILTGIQAILIAFSLGGLGMAIARGRPRLLSGKEFQEFMQSDDFKKLLDRVGPPTGVQDDMGLAAKEAPYGRPKVIMRADEGSIDISRLDPKQKYLWVIDESGYFLLAPEDQALQGFAPHRKVPGLVKHGDLTPDPSGNSRGIARAGGELRYKGNGEWWMTNDSRYSYGGARADKLMLGRRNLQAAMDLLGLTTDISDVKIYPRYW